MYKAFSFPIVPSKIFFFIRENHMDFSISKPTSRFSKLGPARVNGVYVSVATIEYKWSGRWV